MRFIPRSRENHEDKRVPKREKQKDFGKPNQGSKAPLGSRVVRECLPATQVEASSRLGLNDFLLEESDFSVFQCLLL